MKKIKKISISCLSIGLLFFASCVSTPTDQKENLPQAEEPIEEETPGKVIREPKQLTVQNTASEKEKEFKALLERIDLKIESVPSPKKTVYTGSAFSAPYIVSVTDENGPVKDFNITISWPVSRSNDTITFSTAQMQTDSTGKISFLPGSPSIAVKDSITFYPTPVTSSASVTQAAFNNAVTAPYVVKSKYTQYPGGILFVYDFNENGKAKTNDFLLLQELRNAGINAGNAPVSDTSYFNMPVQDVYKECINITQGEIKNAANFLVVGTFKWAKPAEENNGNFTVTWIADFTCIDMKNGAVKYKSQITESASGKTKSEAEKACNQNLASKVRDAIIYGM